MTNSDVGLDFWLRYVEASGGLTEFGGDTTLVMLPPQLFQLLPLNGGVCGRERKP